MSEYVVKVILVFFLILAFFVFLIMIAWNFVIAPLFGVSEISYFQAFLLFLVLRLLAVVLGIGK